MGWLGSFLDRLRGAPDARVDAAAAPFASRGPYRAAGASPVPGGPLVPRRIPQLAGWEMLAILDGDGERYARYQMRSPDAGAPEHALACFAVDPSADDGWFSIAFEEARLLTRLAHRNLGRLVALESDGAVWWHLCERPRGATLADVRSRVRYGASPPGLDVIAAAFADFADGLHAAHAHADDEGRPLGIRYPALGPSALLLSAEGRGQIVDWGLADLLHAYRSRDSGPDGVTSDGQHGHDLGYVAPEQARGRPVDGRTDVFALGVMLHEACTGANPFLVDSPIETIHRVVELVPPPLSALVPGCPPELAALGQRALAKDPAARCDAREMAEGLRAGLAARGAGDPEALVAGYVNNVSSLSAAPGV